MRKACEENSNKKLGNDTRKFLFSFFIFVDSDVMRLLFSQVHKSDCFLEINARGNISISNKTERE